VRVADVDHDLVLAARLDVGVSVVDPDVHPAPPGADPDLIDRDAVGIGDEGLGVRPVADHDRREVHVVEVVRVDVVEGDRRSRREPVVPLEPQSDLEVLEVPEVELEHARVHRGLRSKEHRKEPVRIVVPPRGVAVVDETLRLVDVVPPDRLLEKVALRVVSEPAEHH